MQRILTLFFSMLFFNAPAQELTGIWRGHFESERNSRFRDSLGFSDKYKFETQLNQEGKGFEGVTYSYNTTVFYGKASCVGAISSKTKKVMLTENKLLEVKSWSGGACLMTCFLQYSKVGNEEFLEGTYTSISVMDSSQCGNGTVFLRKVTSTDFYKEPFLVEKEKQKAQEPVAKAAPKVDPPQKKSTATVKPGPPSASRNQSKPPARKSPPDVKKVAPKTNPPVAKNNTPQNRELKQLSPEPSVKESPTVSAPVPVPRVLSTRKNELVQTITTSAKEVTISIYDNGTIDNDTVSVYIDNKLVISRQRLTDKAITLKINLDDSKHYHELAMVAENLGEIPPNTSLMVVKAGNEHHEVRITSTEQKNAVVRFVSEREK